MRAGLPDTNTAIYLRLPVLKQAEIKRGKMCRAATAGAGGGVETCNDRLHMFRQVYTLDFDNENRSQATEMTLKNVEASFRLISFTRPPSHARTGSLFLLDCRLTVINHAAVTPRTVTCALIRQH